MRNYRSGYTGILILFVLIVGLVTVFLITQLKTYFPNNAATRITNTSPWGYSAEINQEKSIVWAKPVMPMDTLTIEAWVKMADFTSDTTQKHYLVMQANPNNNVSVGLWINGNKNIASGKLGSIGAEVWGTSSPLNLQSEPILTTNFWHHLALSKDASTARVFLDGKLVSSGQYFGETPFSNPAGLGIGAYLKSDLTNTTTAPVDQLDGQIDDLRLSDITLYVRDFLPPTKPLAPQTGTVALWNFNIKNCVLSICYYPDVSGQNNDGQVVGMVNSIPSTVLSVPTYKTCRGNTCAIVSGIGTNSCSANSDCH